MHLKNHVREFTKLKRFIPDLSLISPDLTLINPGFKLYLPRFTQFYPEFTPDLPRNHQTCVLDLLLCHTPGWNISKWSIKLQIIK